MSAEELVIAIVRIVGSLPVLVWPFWGGVLAIVVDLSDLFMMDLLHLGGVTNYQAFDKWLDQVYMACFLIVALRWPDPARSVAVALYGLRMVGFVAFEATQAREVLVLFPNVFEFWFLFVAYLTPQPPLRPAERGSPQIEGARASGHPMQQGSAIVENGRTGTVVGRGALGLSFRYTSRNMLVALLVLLALKEAQELALHWFKLFDGFTAVEAVQAVWRWVTWPLR